MDKQKLKFPLSPSRIGKKQLSGYFDPAVIKELKMLSAQTGVSIQGLLNEALIDLLDKYKNKSF
jgi:hypothetical protein